MIPKVFFPIKPSKFLLNFRIYSDRYVNQEIRVCLGYFETPKDFYKNLRVLGCRTFRN